MPDVAAGAGEHESVTPETKGFIRGIAYAAARLVSYQAGPETILREAGILSVTELRKAGVNCQDIDALRESIRRMQRRARKNPMTSISLIHELAAAIRDVLHDTPELPADVEPAKLFHGMACRLVVRLSPIAEFVPRDAIDPKNIMDDYQRVQAVSRDLVRVLSVYKRAGYDQDTVEVALLNTAVRLRRSTNQRASTAQLLVALADEALRMARLENKEAH